MARLCSSRRLTHGLDHDHTMPAEEKPLRVADQV
jgi:hypothetical protein